MPDGAFPGPRAGRFATTRWSLVLAAGQQTNARSAEAMARLCEMYWYPCTPSSDTCDRTTAPFPR